MGADMSINNSQALLISCSDSTVPAYNQPGTIRCLVICRQSDDQA